MTSTLTAWLSLEKNQNEQCFIYLCNHDVWFQIFRYLQIVDILRLLLVSRRLDKNVFFLSKQYTKYHNLSNLTVDKNKLYDWFKQKYEKLIDRLTFSFSFIDCLYFKYRSENKKKWVLYYKCVVTFPFLQ